MEHFSPDWLRLREPYDRAVRSKALARAFLDALPRHARVVDLACGAGANAHYLTAQGRRDPQWLLIDADRTLLSRARDRLPGSAMRCLDLARPRRSLELGPCDGVTASALCDLVSAAWLEWVIGDAARRGLPLLFALTVDGRVTFSPGDPADQAVMRCFRRDQGRGKGFGPALGPRAPRYLARTLRDHGYGLRSARSDWRLGPGDNAMLRALVAGFAEVAMKGGLMPRHEIEQWLGRRDEQISRRRLSLAIGHVDIFACCEVRRSRNQSSRAVTLP